MERRFRDFEIAQHSGIIRRRIGRQLECELDHYSSGSVFEGKKKVGRKFLGLDFIYSRASMSISRSLHRLLARTRIRSGYFDPNRMIRAGGEGERREDERGGGGREGREGRAKDDSARNERSAIERDAPALWFNFWRQLKSDADRGKSVINEPATFACSSALPSLLLLPPRFCYHRRILSIPD